MDDDVLAMYQWFKQSMLSVGRKVKDSRCSDHSKTYQYRAVSKFVDKAREFGLDKNQMQTLVKEIVSFAKDKKLLYRGTAILNMSDIFSICCKRLETSVESTESLINLIESAKATIESGGSLHISERVGGYSRLYSLINSNAIPIEYLAISKQCAVALEHLTSDERSMLPSTTDLLRVRIRLLIDKNTRDQLITILGNDLLDTGVPE
jgi:hypothetical protein